MICLSPDSRSSTAGRFSFHAIVVESSTKNAPKLCEMLYELEHPHKARESYPYLGMYQFVPFLKSSEWFVDNIFHLATLHVKIVDNLKPTYGDNLQDINHVINDTGTASMQGFYGMQTSHLTEIPTVDGKTPIEQLIHSIHNTSHPLTKVTLVQSQKYTNALGQFENLGNILCS